ncbi:ABC transporter ATP-binding protein [Paraoerskovia marina]|uniref:ABC transporter ATP-binding protein n=1 Tax=Paraoerskovia marina TaxID=545619 RepID=UPI0006937CAB|nr:ABC transporter ATP-binding protein [Paraoerskovia marina]
MWGARHVTVRFGSTTALDEVGLDLPEGRVTSIVGGDGAGKTTLVRALLRRVALDGGAVDVPDLTEVGYQPSTSGVWPALSVRQNLEFAGVAYGMSAATIRERGDELLETAALTHATSRLGSELSGGMRQKLGFCMAMLHRPRMLLLDEPSTGVDPVSRVELWRLVTQAAARGTAVGMTTTYLDEAERASTVVALDAGTVLTAGDPTAVVHEVPGTVSATDHRPAGRRTWRRGTAFHTWTPPGETAPGSEITPDLEDALIALSLARTQEDHR